MSYKLTFASTINYVEVNGVIIRNSPYILKPNDHIIVGGNANNVIVNGANYSKDTTLEIKGQDINIEQSGIGSFIEITINFQDTDKIVSTNMLSYFKDKLFEQRTWTFPNYIDFQMGNYESSGADVIVHFPTPLQSGHNELHLAVKENTIAINPSKKQTIYSADNETMMMFNYLNKETADWQNRFTGISLLGDSISSTNFRGIIQFENLDGISQISNYDTDLGYTFTFTQKQGANKYTIKLPARTNGIVMVQEEGKTFLTADNFASNELIDLMFK